MFFFVDLDIAADDWDELGKPGKQDACAAWIIGTSSYLDEIALDFISRGQVE